LPRLDGAEPGILTPIDRQTTNYIEIGYVDRSCSSSLVPVFAAQDGVVTYAGNTAGVSMLSLDHIGGWSTHYSALEFLLAKPTDRFQRRRKQRVRSGDVIGYACRSTLRILFGLSCLTDEGCIEQDPASSMPTWSMLPWFSEPTPRVVTRAAV
jgi:hypothetical protein